MSARSIHGPPARLFRRHVGGRPENHAHLRGPGGERGGVGHLACAWSVLLRQRLGEAEVEDLHRAVGADSDVGRLQVAVNDALVMRGFERVGDLFRNRQRVGKWHRTARNERRQIVARDQLHDQRKRGAESSNP